MFLFLPKCKEAKMIGHLSLIFLILTIHMSCFHMLCTPDLKQIMPDLSVYMLFCVHILKHLETAPVPGSVDQIITELWN